MGTDGKRLLMWHNSSIFLVHSTLKTSKLLHRDYRVWQMAPRKGHIENSFRQWQLKARGSRFEGDAQLFKVGNRVVFNFYNAWKDLSV